MTTNLAHQPSAWHTEEERPVFWIHRKNGRIDQVSRQTFFKFVYVNDLKWDSRDGMYWPRSVAEVAQ